jgi:hypothetical protein
MRALCFSLYVVSLLHGSQVALLALDTICDRAIHAPEALHSEGQCDRFIQEQRSKLPGKCNLARISAYRNREEYALVTFGFGLVDAPREWFWRQYQWAQRAESPSACQALLFGKAVEIRYSHAGETTVRGDKDLGTSLLGTAWNGKTARLLHFLFEPGSRQQNILSLYFQIDHLDQIKAQQLSRTIVKALSAGDDARVSVVFAPNPYFVFDSSFPATSPWFLNRKISFKDVSDRPIIICPAGINEGACKGTPF